MLFIERALIFACGESQLIGVLAVPDAPFRRALVIVVGGPQYRAGSHRQFLLLSRQAAAAGVPVMRFDCRGMGDSGGPERSFESIDEDIACAIDALCTHYPEVDEVVLWGLCDAASAILMYAARDVRVRGLVLLNPWVRSEASLAKATIKHYYRSRLLDKALWTKIVRGQFRFGQSLSSLFIDFTAVLRRNGKVKNDIANQPFQTRMAQGLRVFSGPVLLILSGRDITAKEFLEFTAADPHWDGLLHGKRIIRHDLLESDHTFSTRQWRDQVATLTIDWIASW